MLASVRCWRAIRSHLPDVPAADDLAVRLRHEPRVARKRHMLWDVPLTPDEAEIVRSLMERPTSDYLAFCINHDAQDPLVLAARGRDVTAA